MLVLLTLSFAQPIAANSRTDKSTSFQDVSNSRFTDRYFKVGAMLNRSNSTRFKEIDCNASSPPAFLYGCSNGHDGNQLSSTGDFGSFGSLELAVGYRPSPTIRRELSFHIHPNFKFRGNSNYTTRAKFGEPQPVDARGSAIALIYSHFLEFPIKSSSNSESATSRITPFIGVGLGASSLKVKQTTMNLPNHYTFAPSGSHYDLAWMFALGFSTPIDERLMLDVALHHMNLGEARTGKGDIRIRFHEGERDDILVGVHPTAAIFSITGIQVSLRYSF